MLPRGDNDTKFRVIPIASGSYAQEIPEGLGMARDLLPRECSPTRSRGAIPKATHGLRCRWVPRQLASAESECII